MAEKIGDIKGVAQSLHQYWNDLSRQRRLRSGAGILPSLQKDIRKDRRYKRSSSNPASNWNEKIGDIKGVAQSLHQIGIIYQYKGDYDQALEQYQASKKIAEKIGDIKGVAASLHQIGIIYQYTGDYDQALEHYQASKKISRKDRRHKRSSPFHGTDGSVISKLKTI